MRDRNIWSCLFWRILRRIAPTLQSKRNGASRPVTHCPREQPNSQAIEDNRSTIFPSASSQCSLVVLWLYQRLSAYPSSLVGFAVRLVRPCYDRGMSRWHTVLESIEFGPLHHTLQTAERLRTIVQQVFHQRLVSVHQWFCGFISG